jgi:very-short-patch-repair endonuclease
MVDGMTPARNAAAARTEAIRDAVAVGGGVMRVRRLVDSGWSRRAIDQALEAGAIVRIRNGWVRTTEADPLLSAAARHRVLLTCVTQARRLGLWVLRDEGVHVAAHSHAGRVESVGAVVHWSRPLVPRHPDVLVDPIENVLGLVATCQPFETALAVWESALSKELVDVHALRRLSLPPAARRLAQEVTPFADSGLESFAIPRLRWLKLPMRRQVWICGRRVDLLIGDRLVLQIDGGHHVGVQREADIAHDAALMLLGYHVIRVGYGQMIDRWHEVQDSIMRAVAQGLHLPRD